MKYLENERQSDSIYGRDGKRYRFLSGKTLAVFSLFVMALLAPAYGQEFRGTIHGKVVDPSGALIRNASITATGPTQTYKVNSGANGEFTIPFVQPATYTVTVDAKGFKSELEPGVLIDINSKVDLNIALQIGLATDTVTVVASAGLILNTEDASGGTIMDPEKVQNLPLNGRQAYMLLSLTPGSQFTQTQFGASGFGYTRLG